MGCPQGPDDEAVRTLYEMDALVGRSTLYSALSVSFFERQVALYQVILEAGVAQGHVHAQPRPRRRSPATWWRSRTRTASTC